MKILWFSNCILSNKASSSGTWLSAMADLLIDNGVELYNITAGSKTNDIENIVYRNVRQWILPKFKLINGIPDKLSIEQILDIVDAVAPELIHIWGLENYWSLLYTHGYLKGKVLLEIQGVRGSCAEVCYGGLTTIELVKCIGTKEMLLPKASLFSEKLRHLRHGEIEKSVLSSFKYISTQSDWTRSRIRPYLNKNAIVFSTERSVRKEFLSSERWKNPNNESPILITVSASPSPLKGIHFLLKSVAILKREFPGIKLYIIGNFILNAPYSKQPGYYKFLKRMLRTNDIEENVIFTGPLVASEMVSLMKNADVFVQPTFVESYSLSFAEAMSIGLPAVASFAGALPCLAAHKESALFYSPMDYHLCADCIKQLFCDKDLSEKISNNAFSIARKRNNPERVVNIQLEIYNQIINQ